MKCEDVQRILLDLVYGELRPDDRKSVEQHLAECETCAREADALGQAVEALNDAADEKEPECERLNGLRIAQQAVLRVERSRRQWQRFALAATTAAAVLLTVQFFALRIDVSAAGMTVSWGEPTQPEQPEREAAVPLAMDTSVPPLIVEHESRLDDLDQLVHLLLRLAQTDDRGHEREVLLLGQRVDSIEERAETRWRTLNFMVRSLGLSQNLAQQLSTTELEGDLK